MKKGDISLETLGVWALLAIALIVGFLIVRAIMDPGKSVFDPIFALFPGG